MVPLATGLSDFEAKMLTARLGAEGFLWQLRGVVDSVYPLGGIDVLVSDGELPEARELLSVLGGFGDEGDRSAGGADEPAGSVRPGCGDEPALFRSVPGAAASSPTGGVGSTDAAGDDRNDTSRHGFTWWMAVALVALTVVFLVARMLTAMSALDSAPRSGGPSRPVSPVALV
jgi:hypothetical protein